MVGVPRCLAISSTHRGGGERRREKTRSPFSVPRYPFYPAAQRLYRPKGFHPAGLREKYDN
jgi:hypothetical protein